MFEKAVIHLPGNKTFTIIANNNPGDNKYIKSATLNGETFNRPWITHEEITKGGMLVFEMSPEPNKKWGSQSPPPSLTK
jgi:putative alpha-1,2-mannosidase